MFLHISKLLVTIFIWISLIGYVNAESDSAVSDSAINKVDQQQDGLSQELDELIAFYSTADREEQIKAINTRIRFSGITDPKLFDIAEKNLLDVYKTVSGRKETQYVSWLVQMLAFSGNEKYIPTLEEVLLVAGRKGGIERHTRRSLEVLPQYKEWNEIISQNLQGLSLGELQRARLINMLNAQDPELVRGGASIAYKYFLNDVVVTDTVEAQLMNLYTKASPKGGEDEYAEASAWLCKILGGSGQSKYVATLTKVKETTKAPAIKRWSKKALKKLGA